MNPGVMAGEMIWHSIRRTISVVCVLLVVGAIGWAAYVTFFKPHTNPTKTTSQTADKIINNEEAPRATFGCASLQVRHYYEEREKIKNP